MNNWLQNESAINWMDFEDAATRTRSILERLAQDRRVLSELTRLVRGREHLFALCECHALDDKIVIYDGLEVQNFRIRWRLAKSEQYERVHTHRFSFTTRILHGNHCETLYDTSLSDEQVVLSDLKPMMVRRLVKDQDFTIHHSTYHSTLTSNGAVALLVRGPAEKQRAPILRSNTDHKWYRYGAADESHDRRTEKAMSRDQYDNWINYLTSLRLID